VCEKAVPGKGIKCEINGQQMMIGNKRFMNDHQIEVSLKDEKDINQIYDSGNSVMFVALENELIGIIAVADTIKVAASSSLSPPIHLISISFTPYNFTSLFVCDVI
jgi:Cu+-exporting ATPase